MAKRAFPYIRNRTTNKEIIRATNKLYDELRAHFEKKGVPLPDREHIRVATVSHTHGRTLTNMFNGSATKFAVTIPEWAHDEDPDYARYYLMHELCHVIARSHPDHYNDDGPDGEGHSEHFYSIFKAVAPDRYHPQEVNYKPYAVDFGIKADFTL